MILYFLKGRLQWHGLKGESKQQKYQLIMDRKSDISLDELCSDIPESTWIMSGLWTSVASQITPGYNACFVACLSKHLSTNTFSTGLFKVHGVFATAATGGRVKQIASSSYLLDIAFFALELAL
jgi:hypothetical protein